MLLDVSVGYDGNKQVQPTIKNSLSRRVTVHHGKLSWTIRSAAVVVVLSVSVSLGKVQALNSGRDAISFSSRSRCSGELTSIG